MEFSGVTRMKKTRLILISAILIIVLLGIAFIPFYNAVIHPFRGCDKNFLEEYQQQDIKYKDDFSAFYIDCVNYTQYECYSTEFYYNHGRKAILWEIATIYCHYAYESYSYVVKLDKSDYENVKQQTRDSFKYLKIRVGSDSIKFYDYVDLDEWRFYEIFLNTVDGWSDELYESQEVKFPSFWLAYNDSTQEIAFHCLVLDRSLDYYSGIDKLKKYLKTNLYV